MNKDILPQGDLIRQLLVKSNVTESNINSILREKGVFLGRNEKNNSVPLLMKSVISPQDYLLLYETQKTKEESMKYRTSSIKCKSDFDFANIFEEYWDINALILNSHTYKPNYEVVGTPSFYLEDEYTAILDYEIERDNVLNDWTNNKTNHKGSISLKKVSSGEIQISVQQNSTSKETFEVNNLVMGLLKEKLLEQSVINSNEDFVTVKFNHFDNSSRIKFFFSFCNDFSIYLEFKSITDIDIYLDEDVQSHEDIKMFLDQIDNLKLNGKELQNHGLLKNMDYFPKLIFGAVKFRYTIDYSGINGSAIINFGFPDFVKSKNFDSDFQIQIDLILNKHDKHSKNENGIRKKLLELFETKKVESYEKFKNTTIDKHPVGNSESIPLD